MNNENLRDYLLGQMGYNHLVKEIVKQKYFSRNMIVRLEKHLRDFVAGTSQERWIVIPGLRGVGKTTLIAQVYRWAYQRWVEGRSEEEKINMIYISLDIVRNLDGELLDVLELYESLLANRLENSPKPILLFIDEVQTDPKWARILKTVYDRTSNVFIICTGSAATYLQMDADTAGRRAKIERLYPLSFTEYQMLAHNNKPASGLKQQLVHICYHSASASETHQRLEEMRPSLDQAWAAYDNHQVEDYLQVGTMPFAFHRDKADVYKALMDNIDRVVTRDLATDRRFNFSHASVTTIKQLLTLLASGSTTPSLNTLGDTLKVDAKNLSEMLQALIKAEVLIRVPADGGDFGTARRPVRYQFMSATLRNAYWNITGNRQTAETRRGQLLEDVVALHYYREFVSPWKGSLGYVYSKKDPGHCDFILRVTNSRQIALEFGLGRKTARQTELTMAKVNCDYGIVFSRAPLGLREKVVMVPLRYFFLM